MLCPFTFAIGMFLCPWFFLTLRDDTRNRRTRYPRAAMWDRPLLVENASAMRWRCVQTELSNLAFRPAP